MLSWTWQSSKLFDRALWIYGDWLNVGRPYQCTKSDSVPNQAVIYIPDALQALGESLTSWLDPRLNILINISHVDGYYFASIDLQFISTIADCDPLVGSQHPMTIYHSNNIKGSPFDGTFLPVAMMAKFTISLVAIAASPSAM